MTGPLTTCSLTSTEITPVIVKGQDTGYTKFLTKSHSIGGNGAHVDLIFNDALQEQLLSIDIWVTVNNNGTPELVKLMSCESFNVISTNSKPPSLTNSVRMAATCGFNPNGIDGVTDGVAYLALKGTTYRKALTDAAPYKAVYTGTFGGGYNTPGDSLTFTGTIGSTTLTFQP